jgi:hypothetical protein
MYALTAPGALFLVVVFTLCGAAGIAFAVRSVWPALRAGGRWFAGIGSTLLCLSVFGAGDLLSVTERLACRIADPGCSATAQVASSGGRMDDLLTTIGIPVFVLGGFFLAAAMKRIPGWKRWAWPTRWTMIALFLLTFAAAFPSSVTGAGGLLERLVAAVGAGWIALLALGIRRRAAATPRSR